MTKSELSWGLKQSGRIVILSTVNSGGTPNAAVFGPRVNDENKILVNISNTKTTKINLMEKKYAVMILVLTEKNKKGLDGTKIVLKYIENEEKLIELKQKVENVNESSTLLEIVKIMPYH